MGDRDKVLRKRNIAFSPPDISELEIKEVAETLRSGWITTGPKTKELERRLAAYIGVNKVVCLNSATAAEELILRIAGIGAGDEVLVPAYTYTATASAAIHVGAKVIFIDNAPDSWEMDYDALEAAITSRTKAIIPVDLGGILCDYDRIFQIVERQKSKFAAGGVTDLGKKIQQSIGRVLVIADCAHALGAKKKINGEWMMAGNIADFSSFSFHAVKNFTTAEGGAAAWKPIQRVSDDEIYQWFQLYSLHGQSKDALAKTKLGEWEYDVVAPLYKCNMTDIMAALGIRQLDRYPQLLNRRREIIGKYDQACDEMGIEHLCHYTENSVSSGHLYLTRIPRISDMQRREIIKSMADRGIGCNVHYKPLPMMSGYKAPGANQWEYPNAIRYYENEITLPLHTMLSDEDIEYVTEQFRDVIKASLKSL